ncbi:MAG TPA: FAD:protein FMN transferase, partial [Gammaproteobacteria bacterium]|nr:FAD:protein FMN transferase [Gammaproteobacteria bacterium]
MEIDLGGIGKEYAVDRTVALLRDQTDAELVVNFGGDLYATGPRGGEPWRVAVEGSPNRDDEVLATVRYGALATSGDARRFLLRDGKRYGHILDPRTGWPFPDAPPSITVWGETCMAAGMMATFAILQGGQAQRFLEAQGVPYHLG